MNALPDRALPEIEPGVTIADLKTVEACDAALDRLTLAIPGIEMQLAAVSRSSINQPEGWRQRAEHALRIKKLLLPRLQQHRAALARQAKADQHAIHQQAYRSRVEERRHATIRTAWDTEPEAMMRVEGILRQSRPDLFDDSTEGAS